MSEACHKAINNHELQLGHRFFQKVQPIVEDVINASNDVTFKEDPLLVRARQELVAKSAEFAPEISVYKVSFIDDTVFLSSKNTGNQFTKTAVTSASALVLC